MKGKFRKTAGAIIGYMIICGGILGWIKVSHGTESRMNPALTAMAQIRSEPEGVSFSILGNEIIIDTSFSKDDEWSVLYLTCGEPSISALWTAVMMHIE